MLGDKYKMHNDKITKAINNGSKALKENGEI